MASADDGATSTKLVGTTLQDRYRLTRLIGKGGMGAVYEAVQVPLGKHVAVKVMARELSANEEALARFRREAEVTSRLGHPHIVQVFDFGETPAGAPYLVMEYLDGEDLERRLARVGRLSLAATARVVRQVASALAVTHARGIVHRDLKPGNVFLQRLEEEDDFVKVVDFGISKVQMATTRLTGEKAVLGTPSYMSPEQANGRIDDIDRRTDEWSLACIAYEMLAGHPPFRGDDASAILYQVIYRRPSPLVESLPELPPDVDQVIGRGLSKAQSDRFPTVSAFARALDAVAVGRSIPTDEVNVSGVDPIPREPSSVQTSASTTTFSNTAAEATGPTRRPTRAPMGLYLAAVAVAVSAALAVLSFRASRVPVPAVAGQDVRIPASATAITKQPLKSGPSPVDVPVPALPAAPVAEPAPPTDPGAAPLVDATAPPSEEAAPADVPRARPISVPPAPRRAPASRPKLHLIQDL